MIFTHPSAGMGARIENWPLLNREIAGLCDNTETGISACRPGAGTHSPCGYDATRCWRLSPSAHRRWNTGSHAFADDDIRGCATRLWDRHCEIRLRDLATCFARGL